MVVKMPKKQAKKLPILDVIDAHNWINRAYYAAPKLTTSSGVPTGAVKAFLNMVNKLIKFRMTTRGECNLVVAFDNKTRETWRSKLVHDYLTKNIDDLDFLPEKFTKGYKGTRAVDQDKVDELGPQFGLCRELLEARGIVTYRVKGYEADDVIGTLAAGAGPKSYNLMIWSRDKDFAQLLGKHVRITQQAQGNTPELRVTRKNCAEVYGVKPNRITHYLALTGDGVDNVPGVPGIGPKTALNLLAEHGSINGILKAAKANQIKGKSITAKLTNPPIIKLLALSQILVTICNDLEKVSLNVEDYKLEDLAKFKKKLNALKQELEFSDTFTI